MVSWNQTAPEPSKDQKIRIDRKVETWFQHLPNGSFGRKKYREERVEEIIERKCHSNEKKRTPEFRHGKEQNLICKLGCEFRIQRIKLLKN